MAPPPLTIHPSSQELQFELLASESTPRSTMTLEHSGQTDEPIAFKVKTTQPRRYLVRPNQGVINAGGTATVQILLVEKDKNILWQSYQRLGASALVSKDKFLVQCCPVSPEFAQKYSESSHANNSGEGYQALTALWTKVTTSEAHTLSNQKLHVKHVAIEEGKAPAAASPAPAAPANVSNMNKEQLVQEVANLRRKYDELVAFSVNLTAERDILNNTLEQTKRDLNRQLTKGNGTVGTSSAKAAPGGTSKMLLLVIGFFCLVMGVKLEHMGRGGMVRKLPGVQRLFPAVKMQYLVSDEDENDEL